MTTKTISAQMVEAVSAPLAELGFKRRQAAGVFTLDLGPDVLGWLGLNRATKRHAGTAVEVNPVVGVRHQQVEQLVAELRGEKFHQFIPPTVSRPLGYLMPDSSYTAWLFEPESLGDTAMKLVHAIGQYGVPVMRSITTPEELRRKIEEGWGFPHQLIYRLPVVRWLQGDVQGALEALDPTLNELDGRSDPAAEELRSFARAFKSRISSER